MKATAPRIPSPTRAPTTTSSKPPRAANSNNAYVSAYRYQGDGLEVIKNLSSATAPRHVLNAVRNWHRSARLRDDPRHQKIAAALTEVMG
jgi:hypothetical protein